ncbi:MAG: STAS domain-containing protein, partial [Leptospiraceae bacterium]|nr:STAS domain-containing protein [Leptospiraceae bacterium]
MELLESQSKREIYFKPNNSTENNFAKIILEIEEKIKDNNNLVRVVLDLSNCEKIDSSCIGSLLNIRNSLK